MYLRVLCLTSTVKCARQGCISAHRRTVEVDICSVNPDQRAAVATSIDILSRLNDNGRGPHLTLCNFLPFSPPTDNVWRFKFVALSKVPISTLPAEMKHSFQDLGGRNESIYKFNAIPVHY